MIFWVPAGGWERKRKRRGGGSGRVEGTRTKKEDLVEPGERVLRKTSRGDGKIS